MVSFCFCFQGDALIIPICGQSYWGKTEKTSWESCNQGTAIKFLISAPTMRIPENVSNTVNAYLAFRAVILASKYIVQHSHVENIL